MFERDINGFTFKWDGEGAVNVYKNTTLVQTFPLSGIKDQKEFDKEISWWFMENGNILVS